MASGNRFEVSPLVTNLSLATTVDGPAFEVGKYDAFTVIWTTTNASSLSGSLVAQWSNDGSQWFSAGISWSPTGNTSNTMIVPSPTLTTTSGTGGGQLWPWVAFKYFRLRWVSSTGSATLNATIGTLSKNY